MEQRLEKTLRLYSAEIQSLYADLGLSEDEREDFERKVRHEFIRGVNMEYHSSAVRFLEDEFKSQQEIANELGKRDRTSISKLKSSKRIDGDTLTWLLTKFPDFKLPSRSRALARGYSNAMQYIRKRCRGRVAGGRVDPEHFECLLSLFSNTDWLEAAARSNATQKKEIERQTLQDLQSNWKSPFPVMGIHGLLQVVEDWGGVFLLCIDMIPVSETDNE